jgi:DNA-binding transcriptional MocR family regulator
MQVSTSTVVEAYDRLAAEGVIQARPGSGFYVGKPRSAIGAVRNRPQARARGRSVLGLAPIARCGQRAEAGMRLAAALLAAGGWHAPRLAGAVARAGRCTLADYGTPLGLPPLRQLSPAEWAIHGIEASPDQIMLTESGTQALDLSAVSVEPGDTVLVDDPCYFNFHALLRAHRVRIVSVPYTPERAGYRAVRAGAEEHKPRLYITNSALHNPTGAVLSPVTAHRVLKLADQFGLTIIEDDIFADFEHEPARALPPSTASTASSISAAFPKRCRLRRAAASSPPGRTGSRADRSEDRHHIRHRPLTRRTGAECARDGSYRKHMEGLRGASPGP